MKKYFSFWLVLVLVAVMAILPFAAQADGGRDLHHSISVQNVIPPKSISDNTAIVGAIIDSVGYGAIEYVIHSGAISDNASTYTPLLEDCDVSDCSDNAAVADAYLLGTESAASFSGLEDDTIKLLGYIGNKRYTRLTLTPVTASGTGLMAVDVIRGYPKVRPQ